MKSNRPNKTISLPYGDATVTAEVPDRVIFDGALPHMPPVDNLEALILEALNHPVGCLPLSETVSPHDRVLILIDDNTRHTPVKVILPVLIAYLKNCGVDQDHIEILTAPGTHRIMTASEIVEKVGPTIASSMRISQHDFNDLRSLVDMGSVQAGDYEIPILINQKVQTTDVIIGLGNIVPHCDAGFSGGAKILQPGICGYATTAATHVAAALLEEMPLGVVENPCRRGMEEVAQRAGLRFIINTVMNHKNEVVHIVGGDFVKAHREGARVAAKAFGVMIPQPADIVVVSSHPADIDYWQAEKGIISAYFAVKAGGIVIFVTPCPEGLAHNHPRFREWLKLSYADARRLIRKTPLDDRSADLVSADLAVCNARVREKALILAVSDGLEPADMAILGYRPFKTLQEALDFAIRKIPDGTIGVLPRGGDCLPILVDAHS